ncbi:hypothetical protein PCAR4_620020 [Paraburkholderia caribensis]|nr:hypothetical protein PCAR4_620020 [Paraburkholderia caribensis]
MRPFDARQHAIASCPYDRRKKTAQCAVFSKSGRGERIRTSGLYVPNVALYQAKLHPDLVLQFTRSGLIRRVSLV